MNFLKHTKSLQFILTSFVSLAFSLNLTANCMQPVSGWAFDWDDNIMYMPTQVILFHKKTNETKLISTGDYAKYNFEIGKAGKYQDYEIRRSDMDNTYKYFRDPLESTTENYFISDVKQTVQRQDKSWQGPSWNKFIEALNDEHAAKWTSIITARGHSPQTIYSALEYLQSQGIIKYLPSIENIHPVTHPSYKDAGVSPSEMKTKLLMRMLDKISSCKIPSHNHPASQHVWGFSDDDYANYLQADKELSKAIASGRWRNIKVSLFYTGELMNVKRKMRYPIHSNLNNMFDWPILTPITQLQPSIFVKS